jgi:hypothetical protein
LGALPHFASVNATTSSAKSGAANRRRGGNFSGVEFMQAADPEIEGRKKKKLMADIMKSAGLDD